MASRLQEKYKTEILPVLKTELGCKNTMEVPRLDKIVLNMGVGEAVTNEKFLDSAVEEMTLIAGQRAVKTTARKAVSQFKLREGMKIGCRVTLRRQKMYEFLDRLVNVALPRVRDFNGISRTSFDGNGNYAMGIKEQLIFPEINYDKVEKVRGLDVIIVTNTNDDNGAFLLLQKFGLPFKKK